MKLKKLLLMTMIILVTILAACSDNDSAGNAESSEAAKENLNDEQFPIVKEEITLDIFAGKTAPSNDDWNDVMIFNEYEDMTNIDVNWEMVPLNSLEEKRNLALASGTLPDAFHSTWMPTSDILKYGEQGVFISLNDLIEEHAPNLKKFLEENPDIKKGITFPDGNIYSLPTIFEPEFISMRMGAKPWINQEWLDALGMDMPQTTEEFYDYLKAVKEEDPNGNGEADEIPLGGPHTGWLIDYLKGSFGVGNRGPSTGYIDAEPGSDELRFWPLSDGYKQMLEYMNKLYSEGLLEQNIFTMEMSQYLANATEGLYGATNWFSPVDIFGKEAGGAFTGIPALEGPDGDKQFSRFISPITNVGSFIITNENENPAATIRWIDHFYGEEGMKLFFMGIEGETFEETEDGEYVYMDHITESDEGLTFEQEAAKYLTWFGGGYPSMTTEQFFNGAESSEQSLAAAETLNPNLIEETWPAFIFTNEENRVLSSIGTDITKYVGEMQDKFITGDVPLSEWDNYVETLKSMGFEEYMGVQQAAYERYLEN
ncbi:ABC transporter substrate-binding protein [Virgibacillus profundi]|uniref:ABC transporter substrate-binding protein n=1 Tax=Virgibacillus profundi TaxID=2024555 RepID=A0A2A2IIK9_9BACI|nr:extracellular solute-binding protein [Virgibacillus profundi]PAV31156.1 ABC transporter substrate-binding protein [Virgibacillus profundi]PXY55339.1 ABC transporter substrate-binding protein [Virgibacillus profundi]